MTFRIHDNSNFKVNDSIYNIRQWCQMIIMSMPTINNKMTMILTLRHLKSQNCRMPMSIQFLFCTQAALTPRRLSRAGAASKTRVLPGMFGYSCLLHFKSNCMLELCCSVWITWPADFRYCRQKGVHRLNARPLPCMMSPRWNLTSINHINYCSNHDCQRLRSSRKPKPPCSELSTTVVTMIVNDSDLHANQSLHAVNLLYSRFTAWRLWFAWRSESLTIMVAT